MMKLFLTLLMALGFVSGAFAQNALQPPKTAQAPAAATQYHVPSLAEVQGMARNVAQAIASQYPPAQQATVVGILRKNYSSEFIGQVYKAGVTDTFTATELKRIETEAGYADTPVMRDKIKKSMQTMYTMQLQNMLQTVSDIVSAGLPLPKLDTLLDIEKFAK